MKNIFICSFIYLISPLNIFSQTADSVVKGDTVNLLLLNKTIKQWEEIEGKPILDSLKYIQERNELMQRWAKLQINLENQRTWEDESEMLMGPVNFFNRIEKNGGKATERDKKYARAGIAIIDKREWLPELKLLASKARRILVYIECCL